MNREDLNKFRSIFDDDMTKEGFIWRYQTYLHIDFEQFWLLAIWPRVAGQGHVVNIHCGLFLMNDFLPEDLKMIHQGNLFAIGDLIRKVYPIIKTSYSEQTNNEEGYRILFYNYYQMMKPVIQRIHSSFDAYQFKRDFLSLPYERDWLRLERGKEYIEFLLALEKEDEILEIMKKIKKGQFLWEERYSKSEPPLYKEPSLIGYSPKEAARRIETEKKLFELLIEQYHREQQDIIESRKEIAELERMLCMSDHAELGKEVLIKLENNSSMLRSKFNKNDLNTMRNGWTKKA